MNQNIYKECSRYMGCSANNCPLHINYPELCIDDEDKEKICNIEKQVRLKISSKYPGLLKYNGLTLREYSAKKRYDNLSDDEKKRISEIGKAQLLKIRSK